MKVLVFDTETNNLPEKNTGPINIIHVRLYYKMASYYAT